MRPHSYAARETAQAIEAARTDARALDVFVRGAWRLVVYLSNRYRSAAERVGSDVDDVRQAASIGLLRAIETFDPARGTFVSWAFFWMKTEIRNAIGFHRAGAEVAQRVTDHVELDEAIGDPRSAGAFALEIEHAFVLARLAPREVTILALHYACDYTAPEIGAELGITRQRVQQIEAGALAKLRRRGCRT